MTLHSPTATLIPLFSSSELTGCGYPGLLDRKNRSDMCPRWESNPRLPMCKASTLSTRPGSPPQINCVYLSVFNVTRHLRHIEATPINCVFLSGFNVTRHQRHKEATPLTVSVRDLYLSTGLSSSLFFFKIVSK